ncbi:DUF962 domain-containing protein [Flavobacteriaceae bacterium]|nr:DUF962 domain-containing protein [Flavobacteriaceae bacterium]
MKSQDTWFSEYAVSHQNQTNQKIHYICVPLIFWSIVGLIVSIPSDSLGIENPYLGNWAIPVLGLAMIFYFLNLKLKNSILMLVFALLCIASSVWVSQYISLWKLSLGVFIIAWIGQFYGHKLEGAKPSFLEDLQFLLIGPAWVFEKMTR